LAASEIAVGLREKSRSWPCVGVLKSPSSEMILLVSLLNRILLVVGVLGNNANIFAIFLDGNGASLIKIDSWYMALERYPRFLLLGAKVLEL
jgi:hypothetical protein